MPKLSALSKPTWLRLLSVSALAFFMVAGVVFGATTISTNIETNGVFTSNSGNSIHYGSTGLYGQAAGWEPNPGESGFWFEYGGDGTGESAGMYADDDTLVLWSPGDANILNIYDEDDLPGGDPLFVIDGSGWVGIGYATPEAMLQVGTATASYIDGSGDALIADDLEVQNDGYFLGDLFVYGNPYLYGPTQIGNSAIQGHSITGILTLNQNLIVRGDTTLGADGNDNIIITDADWNITGAGLASFTGINVDGDSLLGDITAGSSMLLEIDTSLNEFYIGGSGGGSLFIGDGGGDSIYIGGDSSDSVNIGAPISIGASSPAISSVLFGGGALDFPSIATSDCAELTLTVTGASVGDTVMLGAPATIGSDLIWNGYVSAVNTVTVRLCNIDDTSAIDPASAGWTTNVVKMAP